MKAYKIGSYSYTFDARVGAIETLVLWSAPSAGNPVRQIARITFIDDAASVPEPMVNTDLSYAQASFKRGALAGLVDMLRNENPVHMTMANSPISNVKIGTTAEPVGEGEPKPVQ